MTTRSDHDTPTGPATAPGGGAVLPRRLAFDHEMEQLRRSVAMLAPGDRAIDRETMLDVLHRLQIVSRRVRHLEQGLRALLDADDIPRR